MKRSLFPENVEVHQADLERTESTKAEEIKARAADGSRVNRDGDIVALGGVVDGLRVTRNSPDETRLDISPGSAYTPSGERIVVEATQLAVSLSDPSDATINIVCLVYTETPGTPRPHETAGTTHNTAADASFRVAVYTQAEYEALPETNEDLDEDATDRIVMLARVLGNGAGVDLLDAEIFQTALPGEYYGARFTSSALLGVNLVSAASLTLPGSFTATQSGRIELVVTDAVTKTLKFHEPGHTTYGATVNVAALDGTTTLTSSLGTTLVVEVASKALPRATGTYTQNITLERVHDAGPIQIPGAEGVNFSPSDHTHRENLGSGSRSIDNPHGVHINDMAQGILRYLRSLDLGRGLIGSASTAEVPRLVTPTIATAGMKTLLWEVPTGSKFLRFYQDVDSSALELTLNAQWSNVSSLWSSDAISGDAFRLTLLGDGSNPRIALYRVTASASFAGSTWVRVLSSDIGGALPALITLGASDSAESDVTIPRVRIDGAPFIFVDPSTQRTFMFQSRARAESDSFETVNIYRAHNNNGTTGRRAVEFVYNAAWNEATDQWEKYDTGLSAYKLELAQANIRISSYGAAGPFVDSAWATTLFDFAMGSGTLTALNFVASTSITTPTITVTGSATVGNDLTVTDDITAADYLFSPTKTSYVAIPPSAGIGRIEGNPAAAFSRYEPIASGSPFSIPSGGPTTPSIYVPYWRVTSANAADEAVAEFPLNVPHGVTLTHLQVQADVDDTGGSPRVRIIRVPVTTGGSPTYASLSDTLLSDTGGAPAGTSIGLSIVIDSLTYAYYIVFGDSAGAPSSTIKIYGMRITYTTSEVRV